MGDAWALNNAKTVAPRLHAAVNSHPTLSGSYLAALVIYGRIYDADTRAVDYQGGLSEAEASHLQRVAVDLRFGPDPCAVGSRDRKPPEWPRLVRGDRLPPCRGGSAASGFSRAARPWARRTLRLRS